jgi:flagellar biosynthesis/type III secretory pathway chaperone
MENKQDTISMLLAALEKCGADDHMQLKVAQSLSECDPKRSLELFLGSKVHILMLLQSFEIMRAKGQASIWEKIRVNYKKQKKILKRVKQLLSYIQFNRKMLFRHKTIIKELQETNNP